MSQQCLRVGIPTWPAFDKFALDIPEWKVNQWSKPRAGSIPLNGDSNQPKFHIRRKHLPFPTFNVVDTGSFLAKQEVWIKERHLSGTGLEIFDKNSKNSAMHNTPFYRTYDKNSWIWLGPRWVWRLQNKLSNEFRKFNLNWEIVPNHQHETLKACNHNWRKLPEFLELSILKLCYSSQFSAFWYYSQGIIFFISC